MQPQLNVLRISDQLLEAIVVAAYLREVRR